ncbi:Phosphatidylinositol 4-kinase pik1alpha (PI4-kinase)(PtdIns-4-kinase) [Dipsacomyces acuminosporus]|nr:Phosphatidylinositol 4-kinase pik1alpha (PI4-kinase)(PtdIns-4-kinase) [Dipsacomyces acuminosporus]
MALNPERIDSPQEATATASPAAREASAANIEENSTAAPAATEAAAHEHTTNSSLLLRLFTSQFFDSWMAVSYLFRYPHIVGVQHYLCNELRKLPLGEIEFFLPQLVHLLITRPNESTAVESLLLDVSLRSSHIAMLLYWYLQAYLSDLAPNPRTASFRHCQRIFNQMQELLFTDIAPELIIDAPEPVQYAYVHVVENGASSIVRPGPLASLAARFKSMFRLTPQIRENSFAAMVGISSSLSSIGAPSLAPTMGWMAIAQGQCSKISEKLDDAEPDLPPQKNLLSGRTRSATNSSPVSRSSSMSRSKIDERRELSKNKEDGASRVRKAYTGKAAAASADAPAGTAAPASAPSAKAREAESSMRMSSSQPTRLSINSHMPEAAGLGAAASSTCTAAETSLAYSSAPSNNDQPSSPTSTGAAALHNALGSRSPTPAGRDSTDSCRTVAIMEKLERTKSVEVHISDTASTQDSGNALPRKQYLDKAAKQFQRNAKQLDRRMNRPLHSPKSSSSNGQLFTGNSPTKRATSVQDTLADIAAYMEKERRKLEHRTGYFGAEIKFMTSLMDISQRVCAVPKAGRQQFLKAELTLLNHSLDKNTCIPLWCPDSGGFHHHRIVRIPTEDTVVLNSAERAPYLLTLEILEPNTADGSDSLGSATKVVDEVKPMTPSTARPSNRGSMRKSTHAAKTLGSARSTALTALTTASTPRPSSRSSSSSVTKDVTGAIAALSIDIDAEKSSKTSTLGSLEPRSALSPAPPASAPPATTTAPIQDVDEDLMAEVFGDLDNVTDVATSPLAMVSNRRQTGRLAESEVGKSKGKDAQPGSYGKQSSGRAPEVPRQPASNSRQSTRSQPTTPVGRSAASAYSQPRQHEQPASQAKAKQLSLSISQQGGNSASSVIRAPVSQEEIRALEYKDDPSAKVLKEDWESKKARIRRASPYGRYKNWNLLSVIVKEGADLRQEQLALQLIREMQRVWQREHTDVFVQYYRIMVTGEGCGLMETITNTVSVHSIKKEFYSRNPDYAGPPYTLYNYFVTSYGTPDTEGFRKAQDNFMRSLVSYSLITYILQIRDRHNGNILLDTAGHIIHIDFGFMLSNSPGSVGFEQAPFKFPMEYVDILGGRESAKFAEFRELLVKAFLTLRKYADNICLLVEMMIKDSPLPCLNGGAYTVAALRDRFHLVLSEQQAEEVVNGLLVSSCDNVTTRMYDAFQYYSNGIL